MSTTTLRGEARALFRHPGPWLIAVFLIAAAAVRISMGEWGWTDLVIAAVILGFEPFTEWLIHVHVLHAKPRKVFGRDYDGVAARKHRLHHLDPTDRRLVLVPAELLLPGLPLAAVLALVLAPVPRHALTGLAVGYGMLLAYEWIHALIHSSYKPRHGLYRHLWRSHRLHHFRNEHYWFGVTMTLGDRVLGTAPAKDEVPLSPTARTLGIETNT